MKTWKGLYVVHINALDCEINRVFCETFLEANLIVMKWAKDIDTFNVGDTIRFEAKED